MFVNFYASNVFVDADYSYLNLADQIDCQAFPLIANEKENVKIFIYSLSLQLGPSDKMT
jgi:hypothetical protein